MRPLRAPQRGRRGRADHFGHRANLRGARHHASCASGDQAGARRLRGELLHRCSLLPAGRVRRPVLPAPRPQLRAATLRQAALCGRPPDPAPGHHLRQSHGGDQARRRGAAALSLRTCRQARMALHRVRRRAAGASARREHRMQERNLGSSGLRVSLVGLGCNNFGGRIDLEATRKVVHKALDLGITLFDTADVYGERGGSERFLGEVLGERRKDIVLATKFGMDMDDAGRMKGGSRAYVMKAVEDSLRRLRTHWIDLYQLHRADPLTPIEETLRALDDLVRQGKVRYIGCSNLAAWQVVEAHWTADTKNFNAFASCQDEYSLVVRDIERELVPAIEAYRMGLLPFFPLASGLLTGKYKRDAPPPKGTRLATTQRLADRYMTQGNWRKVEGLADFAKRHGRSLLELAFSWLAAKPYVSSVIAGATKPEQLEQNVKAVEHAGGPR